MHDFSFCVFFFFKGVLERENKTDVNDELLHELKRLQSLLIPISEFNLQKKKALLLRAKAEIAKQEAQKRIQETDAKVLKRNIFKKNSFFFHFI